MSTGTPALSVNLNKIALLRNTRPIDVPALERAATIALDAGAHGLTVHPRPDGRHIRPADVPLLARLLARRPDREFNIEGNPLFGTDAGAARPDYPGFAELARQAAEAGALHQLTLVPDEPGQATSDHGWDLDRSAQDLGTAIAELKQFGARISLFMDPVPDAMATAAALGADRVELYTEPYARAFEQGDDDELLDRYAAAADAARAAGLEVNAGHDLNLENLGRFVDRVPGIREVSIGHALTADALWMGLDSAVRAYLEVLRPPAA
jgi:pyridoxine 5-phosphate synthase